MTKQRTDRAIATTSGPMRTPAEMVALGTSTINAITGSPALTSAPGVKSNLDLWATENASLDALLKKKADLKQQLSQADADETTLVRHWGLRRQGVLHEVNLASDGSQEKVQSFNLPVVVRTKTPPATVPENLHAVKSKKGTTATVAWSRTAGNHGYLVQYAADPNNPATYAKPSMCKRARFALPGQVLGATLQFRVLALDPSLPAGQSDYTAWVAVTVGA